MKLTVKNFGPIHEAKDINVSPMTVFVGPSNTGKSYLAILVYAIMKALEDKRRIERISHQITMQKIDNRKRSKLFEISSEIYKEISKPVNLAKLSEKTQQHGNTIVDECFSAWAVAISQMIKKQIVHCFGEVGQQILEDDEVRTIEISESKNQFILDVFSPENSKFIDIPAKQEIIELLIAEISKEFESHRLSDDVIYLITKKIIHRSCGKFISLLLEDIQLFGGAHYLPAIRGGIMQSHRTLVSTLVEHASMAGLNDRFKPIPLFSGVLSDFMTKLIQVPDGDRELRFARRALFGKKPVTAELKKIKRIGSDMETHIMDGKIEVQSSETRYPDFRYVFEKQSRNYNLPLMSVSSMVSELAPVSLFIRHYVQKGDLFILEEPEAHLHPAAQREISNILVQLVNAGVYVLITTHSDNILEQISNCMHASFVDKATKIKALAEEKTSVYLFDKPKRSTHKNTVVKPVKYDSDMGILSQDHLDVSSALYNQTVSLLDEKDSQNEH